MLMAASQPLLCNLRCHRAQSASIPPGSSFSACALLRWSRPRATTRFVCLGRVAPDEERIYKLNAGIEGYIQDVSAATTGSFVKKDQVLATFSAPNASMPLQTFVLNLGAEDRFKKSAADGTVEGQSMASVNANLQLRTQQLQNLGMSALQMEEIRGTRQIPDAIKIVSPVDGFVLSRSVSPGQKFERDTEWFRIADLHRVWIVADVFESEAQYLKPGMQVRVSLPDQNKFSRAGSAMCCRSSMPPPEL